MSDANALQVPSSGKRLIVGVSLFVRGAGQSLLENCAFQTRISLHQWRLLTRGMSPSFFKFQGTI